MDLLSHTQHRGKCKSIELIGDRPISMTSQAHTATSSLQGRILPNAAESTSCGRLEAMQNLIDLIRLHRDHLSPPFSVTISPHIHSCRSLQAMGTPAAQLACRIHRGSQTAQVASLQCSILQPMMRAEGISVETHNAAEHHGCTTAHPSFAHDRPETAGNAQMLSANARF